MSAFSSIRSSSSRIQVPSAAENVERTCSLTPWLRATSTERTCSTFAPDAAISSISSDRKSTRLNSSHLVISYAVFCLKKKKTRVQGIIAPRIQFAHHCGVRFALYIEVLVLLCDCIITFYH